MVARLSRIALLFMAFWMSTHAQSQGRYWSMGLSLGVANYLGDITPKDNFSFDGKFTRFSIGVDATKRFSPRLSLKTGLSYLRIAGDDFTSADPNDPAAIGRYIRNLHFRNDILELSAQAVFDIISTESQSIVNPYLHAGIAGFYHNPKAKAPEGFQAERWVALQPLKTEGVDYSRFAFAVPVGLGLEFKASKQFSIGVNLTYRVLFTDYLDDVSADRYVEHEGRSPYIKAISNRSGELYGGFYRDARVLPSGVDIVNYVYTDNTVQLVAGGVTPASGERRGDPANDDAYFTTMIRLQYHFKSDAKARYRLDQ